MKHNKSDHKENLSACWNYQTGNCYYNHDCWFSHKLEKSNDPHLYKCNCCDKEFKIKKELYKHMKLMHIETVEKCRLFLESTCPYNNCWFSHNEYINEEN